MVLPMFYVCKFRCFPWFPLVLPLIFVSVTHDFHLSYTWFPFVIPKSSIHISCVIKHPLLSRIILITCISRNHYPQNFFTLYHDQIISYPSQFLNWSKIKETYVKFGGSEHVHSQQSKKKDKQTLWVCRYFLSGSTCLSLNLELGCRGVLEQY